jgi:lysophospholipase
MQEAARALAAADAPLVLLGHSHGGLITLRALADERPPRVAAAILSSPFLALRLAVPGFQLLLARIASRIAPKLAQPNALRVEDLTQDKAKQAERTADKLCFDVATARWFTEAGDAQEYVLRHANAISVPTMWLVAGDDPIADPARSRIVYERLRTPGVFHDLAGFRHEVFNEVERGRAFGLMTEFVTRETKLAA